MLHILRLSVRSAAGSGWEHALKETLRQIDGVVGVTASYKASLIGITYDANKVSSGALRARVESLGYEVSPVG